MGLEEAREQYEAALKAGRKTYRENIRKGRNPYLQVLDEILDGVSVAGHMSMGLVEIPADMIAGTKTAGRTAAFAADFMPLLPENSEFGAKWIQLCSAHLSDEGIRDPVRCYEYLGRFYVLEGNKRVSVLKSYGARSVPGVVTRLIPEYSEDYEIKRYYEFMDYYQKTKLYQVRFTRPGSFPKLQAALGYEPDHVWTQEQQRIFRSGFCNFSAALEKFTDEELSVTTADILLVWLLVYPFEGLKEMSPSELVSSLHTIWQDVKALEKGGPIEVSTDDESVEDARGFMEKLKATVFPSRLKVAFIHELSPEVSNWTSAHEEGRHKMQEIMGDKVETLVYMNVGTGFKAEAALEDAARRGVQLIFTSTPSLIAQCRKFAAQHPNVKILNCSVAMAYTGVRTFYSRMYEGKFIAGAIAGAISRCDNIGYVASYPIFGVPAEINAFALGAQLTNPRARIELKWACVPGQPVEELKEKGHDVISALDVPIPGWSNGLWGTFLVKPDGDTELLASPYWDWGTFYTKLVTSVMDGGWDTLNFSKDSEHAVNYWWGLDSGVVGIEYADAMPDGVKALALILEESIINDSIRPFHRPIVDQNGTVRNDGSKYFSYQEILNMDWLCDNVDGKIPSFEEMTEKGQNIARVQGIYRDNIIPEKEGVIL